MRQGKDYDHDMIGDSGVYKLHLKVKNIHGLNMNWPSRIIKYQEKIFIPCTVKIDGIFYFYIQIMDDLLEANKFSVAIAVSNGVQTGIINIGKVFPIDAKVEEIIKEKAGVLSFPGEMSNTLIEDLEGGKRRINLSFKLSKFSSSKVLEIISYPFSISSGL